MQYDFGTIDPYVVDGVELANMLNQWRDALYNMQRGPSRPPFAVPGQVWVNDAAGPTAWLINLYISPSIGDVPLFTVNTVTGEVTLEAIVDASAAGALLAVNNLSDLVHVPTARGNLGLGALATKNTVAGGDIVIVGQAQGALMWLDAGAWKPIPAGAADQVLTSRGPALAPIWGAGGSTGYAWSVKMTGADQAAPHATWIKAAFNAAQFEQGGSYFSTSLNRVTPPAGTYFVTAMGRFNISGGVSKNAYMIFRKNGVDIVPVHSYLAYEPDSGWGTVHANAIVQVGAGDYLECWVRSDASNGGTFFWTAANANWDGFRIDGVKGLQGDPGVVGGTDLGASFLATSNSVALAFGVVGIVAPFNLIAQGNVGGFYNNATYKYKPPAGRYLIGFNVYANSGSGGTNETFQLRKNGVSVFQAIQSNGAGSGGSRGNSGYVEANGTDEFDVYLMSNPGNSGFFGTGVGVAYSTFWAVPANGIQGAQGASGTPAGVTAKTYDQYTTYGSLPGSIPYDNTPPLITEGSPIFSRSFTAASAAHRIEVECSLPCSANAAANASMALFIDGTCVRTDHVTVPGANFMVPLYLKWDGVLAAGAHAYEIRVGIVGGGLYTNGPPTGAILGGTLAGVLTIEELNAP